VKKIRVIFYLPIFLYVLFFFFLMGEKIGAVEYEVNSIIYSFDTGGDFIVYEYKDYINNDNLHYLAITNRKTGEIKKIMSNGGEYINNDMFFPSISEDGKYITFTSNATNITDDYIEQCMGIIDYKKDFCSGIYLYNVEEEKSYLIKDGDILLNGNSYVSKISGDGRYIVFESSATNKINKNLNNSCYLQNVYTCINIYKYNVITKNIILISTNKDNYGGNASSISPSISYDGRYITFQSTATNLYDDSHDWKSCKNIGEAEEMLCSHLFLMDAKENKLILVTKINNEVFNDSSGNGILSDNGKYIVYESFATNIENIYNNKQHIVLYDVENKKNTIVSKKENIPNNKSSYLQDISSDGKYITYITYTTNLSEESSVYIYNTTNNKIFLFNKCSSDQIFLQIDNRNIFYYDGYKILERKIDTEPPKIQRNQEIYVLQNSFVLLKDKIIVNDNLSDIYEMDIFIESNLIFNEVGDYIVEVTVIDEFDNLSKENVKVIVLEKDEEGPVFSNIDEIKILKGSQTLNLSNYIESIDKIDGISRIYVINDGNLDLNKSGKYKIQLMSKDSSENITYKELYIVVYENYNFNYYYELLLIIGLIAAIIFSIIKVK